MGTTFENEILEIFGTTDLEQLKKISRDVASYNQKSREIFSEERILLQKYKQQKWWHYTVRKRVSQILQENIRFHVRQSIIS